MSVTIVTPIPVMNLRDIPALMRKTADAIERGEYGDVATAVLILDVRDDDVQSFGWGNYDDYKHIGMLSVALQASVNDKLSK